MDEEPFYVGIREPVEIRRNLLESSKAILQNLQRYEKIKSIREEKVKTLNKLKKAMGELKTLHAQLKKALPDKGLRAVKVKSPKAKKVKKEKEDEIKSLEKELNEVERELSKLR